ncbi:MAG: DUF3604 domain-containing protein, partial [Deltaproteobacteria bacterium]|nr:DUF3604 domain-containing protein [Deltaproteobacteria bacterium]
QCKFELLDSPSLLAASGVTAKGGGAGSPPPSEFNERMYVRNILKDGLVFEQQLGVNPFKLGIIAATDSHNGNPSFNVEDERFGGHLGLEDAIPVQSPSTVQDGSGGVAVVWAEENSRDAIFEALKRKETYGTSGTRPIVRFFGGWNFKKKDCEANFVEKGYQRGVPMGGDLPPEPPKHPQKGPTFVTAAWMDDYIGTPLQQIQIVKGWVENGQTKEKVFKVAGKNTGAKVDAQCNRVGDGFSSLCSVWSDPNFDPTQPAFYYVRVLENPVCRYSTLICQKEYGINPLDGNCDKQLAQLDPDKQDEAAMWLGALLFVTVSSRGSAPPATRLVIPASRIEAALREYKGLKRQPLTPEERQSVIQLLEDQEVLYAYALRLGLDKDPVVERRLSQIATFVSENPHEAKSTQELANEAILLGLNEGDLVVRRILIDGARRLIRAAILVHEPSDSVLEQYLHEHMDEFRLPARVRLSHVLVDPRTHKEQTEHDARELLARLRADSVRPEQAAEYGDHGLVAANLSALPEVELERRFGHRFVEQLAGLSGGSWDGPISSRYGLHLVFVQERIPERVASLAEVRNDVRARVRNKLADAWLETRLGQLRAEFQVEVEDAGSQRGRS